MNYSIEDEIADYIERLGRELEDRGRLYEKYGSGIRSSLEPLVALAANVGPAYPHLVRDFLEEFFS